MVSYPEAESIKAAINDAEHIVIVQADNPDADSLASSIALEHILGDMGKSVSLYCGVDIPSYLHYIMGADRVTNELPTKFDLSIIVDTSSNSLLQQLEKTGGKNWLAAKPSIIVDHHATKPTITFASIVCNHKAVASGEVIYELSQQLGWQLNHEAKKNIAIAILSDSLGLTTEDTSARSIHIIGELVEAGVSLAELDSARRETMRRESELIHYKGELLQRVEFYAGDRIATVTIPYEEIEKYSPIYNPSMLVLDDMRLAKDVAVAVAFKTYPDGKVTAKVRCNYGVNIADKLAEHFGGGGHSYAAGFKIQDGRKYEEIKQELITYTSELLNKLEE